MALVDANSTWRVLVAGPGRAGRRGRHRQPDAGLAPRWPPCRGSAAAWRRVRSSTARQLGFALGVAALGTVFTAGATRALRDAGAPTRRGWRRRCRPGRRRRSWRRPTRVRGGRLADAAGARATPTGCGTCSWRAGSAGIVGRPAGAVAGPRRRARRVRRSRSRMRRPNPQRADSGRRQTAGHAAKPMPDDWQRALVVAAHPDDIEYGIAAAVSAWTAAGKEVHYLLATRGEAGMEGVPPEEAGAAARGGGAALGRRRRCDRGRVPRPPGRTPGRRAGAAAGPRRGDPAAPAGARRHRLLRRHLDAARACRPAT